MQFNRHPAFKYPPSVIHTSYSSRKQKQATEAARIAIIFIITLQNKYMIILTEKQFRLITKVIKQFGCECHIVFAISESGEVLCNCHYSGDSYYDKILQEILSQITSTMTNNGAPLREIIDLTLLKKKGE